MNINEKLHQLLRDNNIGHEVITHDRALTCEQSALARGLDLKFGGKTLLFKDKKDFRLFVISASQQVDSAKVRSLLMSQKLRFATNNELAELCGVEKGALIPFGGGVIYPFDLYLDESILANEFIAFNSAILTESIVMRTQDYLRLVKPFICNFSK